MHSEDFWDTKYTYCTVIVDEKLNIISCHNTDLLLMKQVYAYLSTPSCNGLLLQNYLSHKYWQQLVWDYYIGNWDMKVFLLPARKCLRTTCHLNILSILLQIIMPRLDWRWLLGLSSIPSFILLAFLGFQPESPRYLCLKGRTAEAHRALEKIAQVNKTKLPNGKLVAHRSTLPTGERAPPELVHLLSSNGGNKTTEGKSGLSLFLMLFSSKLARTTILLWLLLFGNSFAYYAVVLLISELSSLDTRCHSPSMFSHHPQDANLYIDEFITSLAGTACDLRICFP